MDKTRCECTFEGDSLTCVILGEIDHHTAKPLREALDAQIYLYRAGRVILDLDGVGFMDSAGLGLILGRYTKVRELGGTLILRAPSDEVCRILHLAGVDKMIKTERKCSIK